MKSVALILMALFASLGCSPATQMQASGTCSAALPTANDCPPCLAPGALESMQVGGVDPLRIRCNSQVHYGRYILRDARVAAARIVKRYQEVFDKEKSEDPAFREQFADSIRWWMVRSVLLEGDNNNFGVLVLKDHFWTDAEGNRRPVLVFRMAYTLDPLRMDSCFRSVVEAGEVKHVVNLYDGSMPVEDLDEAEAEVAAGAGASYVKVAMLDYGRWRHALEDNWHDLKEREEAFKAMGRLIKEQILLPGGKPPRGNILIHCGGGMHRSGMISGILQYHINGDSLEQVARVYRFHVGYVNEDNPGGFEPENLKVIEQFNPAYLK